MKNKKYFGLANGENGLYKTLDNGQTWESISLENSQSGELCFGRIIFGSNENKGLTYSDDGGITRNPSNITDGNWGLIRYSKDRKLAYAASFDNRGVVVSRDYGEFWEETSITDGSYNTSWTNDNGDVVYGGNDGGVIYDGNNNGVVIGIPFGLGTVATSNGNINTSVEKKLIPVINKIIAPQIYLEITGKRYYNNVEDLNLLKPEAREFYINSDNIYETNIDWEQDLGMRPFKITIEDILPENTNVTIAESIKNNDTEIMKKNIEKVRNFITARKNAALQEMSKRILDAKVDNSNIMELEEVTPQETLDAVTTQKSYADVLKASTVVVMNNIYERIFAFDNSMIRKLIYAGIYETIVIIAGNLKRQLDSLEGERLEAKDINIKYDFSQGLKVAFDKYLYNVSHLVTVLNEAQDKDLIAVAADYYRSQKSNYLKQAADIFKNIEIETNDCKRVAEISSYTADNFVNDMYKKILLEFQKTLNINFKFPTGLEAYTIKERKIICKYSEIIHKKFISRCFEYTKYVFENELEIEPIVKDFSVENMDNIKIEFLKKFKLEWDLDKEII